MKVVDDALAVLEAAAVLAYAEGQFETEVVDGVLRVRYTGTDHEEEGRIAQALLVIAQASGAELESIRTDDVHVGTD